MTVSEPQILSAAGVKALQTLRKRLQGNTLQAGQRIPSERALASDLGVSRTALRGALAELEKEGAIQQVSPRVRIVSSRQPASPVGDVLSQTIAVVTAIKMPHGADEIAPGQQSPAFFLGASEGIQESGRNILTLSPKQVGAAGAGWLTSFSLQGVIALEDATNKADCERAIAELAISGAPVVAHGDALTDEQLGRIAYDVVLSDHEQGSYDLTCWLAQSGCRRIMQFWSASAEKAVQPSWCSARRRGYEAACRDCGVPVLPVLAVPDDYHDHNSRQRFDMQVKIDKGFLMDVVAGDEPVDAFMCLTDMMCFHLAAALRELGVDPVEQIRIVGYDNFWQQSKERDWSGFIPAATVEKHSVNVGRSLLTLLDERVSGALPGERQRRKIGQTLVPTENQTGKISL